MGDFYYSNKPWLSSDEYAKWIYGDNILDGYE